MLRPGDYLVALLLLGLGFAVRELVFRASGSLWEELRHLFDIEVPTELEDPANRVRVKPLPPEKRRSCPRCGSAMVFLSLRCDTCERLGIPPAPSQVAWEPPVDLEPVDFASHATWVTRRAVPHRLLGPAVLRLKVAMAAVFATAAWNLVLSGFAPPGWFRIFLLAAGALNLLLLFPLRRKSAPALGAAALLICIAAAEEFQDPTLGWLLVAIRAMTVLAVAQAFPSVWQLQRAENRDGRDAGRAA